MSPSLNASRKAQKTLNLAGDKSLRVSQLSQPHCSSRNLPKIPPHSRAAHSSACDRWIRVRLELPHGGTQCWGLSRAEIGVHPSHPACPGVLLLWEAARGTHPPHQEPGAGFTTSKQGKAQEQDAGPAAPATPESHTALAQRSDLVQASWQCPALLRAAKAGANHLNELSSPSP